MQDHLRQCIDQIEELFISGSSKMDHETTTSMTTSPSKASTASTSSGDSGLLMSSPSPKKSAGNSNGEGEEKQRTPTEVFRVSALCVT